MNYQLKITLLSDTTFGRGDGVAGLIDTEIEYDVSTGLPFVRGRTLRGLLVEECANLLYALQQSHSAYLEAAVTSAKRLFGVPGSKSEDAGLLFVGPAGLPEKLRKAVLAQVKYYKSNPSTGISADNILESLTTLRRQTAIDEHGVPVKNSLRTERAALRSLKFTAELKFAAEPEGLDEDLLAACALCLRRGGLGRNRGRGKLKAELWRDGTLLKPTAFFPEVMA